MDDAATTQQQEPTEEDRRTGEPDRRRAPATDQRYEVLARYELPEAMAVELNHLLDGGTPDASASGVVWVKVATVTVPPRTTRAKVVEQALERAPSFGPRENGDTRRFKVLDADSAAEIPATLEAPAPELRIG